jgi:hypothetical protein
VSESRLLVRILKSAGEEVTEDWRKLQNEAHHNPVLLTEYYKDDRKKEVESGHVVHMRWIENPLRVFVGKPSKLTEAVTLLTRGFRFKSRQGHQLS